MFGLSIKEFCRAIAAFFVCNNRQSRANNVQRLETDIRYLLQNKRSKRENRRKR